jgi:hypothetical protein
MACHIIACYIMHGLLHNSLLHHAWPATSLPVTTYMACYTLACYIMAASEDGVTCVFRLQAPEKKTRKKAVYKGEPVVIDSASLDSYLGKPPFDSDRFYKVTPPGVVMGLAWTSMGGSTLYVESNKVSASGAATLTITGILLPSGMLQCSTSGLQHHSCSSFFLWKLCWTCFIASQVSFEKLRLVVLPRAEEACETLFDCMKDEVSADIRLC